MAPLRSPLSGDGNTAIVGGRADNFNTGAAWVFAAAAPAAASDLTITKSHTGNFRQGDTGDTYTITVTNPGPGATSGTVTVTDTLPTGLTPTAPNGVAFGWSCSISGQTLTCTRSDVLASGATYPAITLTVNVANNAAATVTNTASVSGGGEINTANDTASDITTVVAAAVPPPPPPAAVGGSTLSTTGMVLMVGLLAMAGFLVSRRL